MKQKTPGGLIHKQDVSSMKLTGAQILIECLVEQRVDTVFGIPAAPC
jgi:hypothetical protein